MTKESTRYNEFFCWSTQILFKNSNSGPSGPVSKKAHLALHSDGYVKKRKKTQIFSLRITVIPNQAVIRYLLYLKMAISAIAIAIPPQLQRNTEK